MPKVAAHWWRSSRILLAMQPGEWYARPDLLRLTAPDVSYDLLKRKVVAFKAQGWLEEADNPDWRPEDWARNIRGRTKPKYLFRLTPKGEAERLRRMLA